MKFAICNETYEGWSFEDQVRNVSELGYDGLEIAPYTLASDVREISTARRKEMRTVAADHGIELTGLHWLLISPKGLYLTTPDEAVYRTTVEYLQDLVRFCGEIGGQQLVLGSNRQRNIPEGGNYDDGWARAQDAIRTAAETAGSCGVYFLVESLPPPDCNFICNLEEARRMVEAVDHPNCQMMVDVKSMCAEGKPLDELIMGVGDRLKYVHANDANLRGPGFGDIDFRPVFSALNELGYDGYVSVEVFDYKPDPVTIARESLAYLRRTMDAVTA
jgi:D-psicose/D-tagatose/L-ribulose 3-epimerase